ncbi:MAG TPA: DUF2127 domain-containing protein [Acidimicrobiales bacterium]|nr:DUF2127 domain-containing protein [Acidimicrobiales bacterium]
MTKSGAYSAKVGRSRRSANRYELLSCALKGHALVGTDASEVGPDDAPFVREEGAIRWHRCLRCDAWIPLAHPARPRRQRVPPRDEILLPARGPVLRDKYVLRLIAAERAVHVLAFGTLAVILFTFARHDVALHKTYVDIMNDLSGGDPGERRVRGIFGDLGHAFNYSPHRLVELGLLLSAYAVLETCEMVGLWFGRRWAEYLTFVATTSFIPFEIYELSLGASRLKVLTLVINVAIVLYLLIAKRLFGIRGGHRAALERGRALSGWSAVDRATPPVEAAIDPG